MALEIERKFLVSGDCWRSAAGPGKRLRQGYLTSSAKNSVRVRIVDDAIATLTIKSGYRGLTRDEFEYVVPIDDAVAMLALCRNSVIDKTRYEVPHCDLVWEVDEFAGDNAGLIIAEIELSSEDQEIAFPAWIGQEVTGELRFQNSQLSIAPYSTWQHP